MHHVWYARSSLAKGCPYCFISRFPSNYGMMFLKVSTFGPKIDKHLGFSGAPHRTINFRAYLIVWQGFAKIGSGTSKNLWTEKNKQHE